jgi:hypothetical protein
MIKRGITRKLGRPPVQKLPITIDILKAIFDLLDMSENGDLFLWAASLVCFYGLLRKNTLLPVAANSVSSAYLVRGEVCNLCKSSFLLRIRQTKTIQFGQRIPTIPYVSCDNEDMFPVTYLLRHLVRSPMSNESPLFSYLTNYRCLTWTHSAFVGYLKQCLGKVGLNMSSYSGHSFRRGGCSLCFQAGMSVSEIKLREDWKSQSFERYLYIPAAEVFKGAVKLADFAAL